LICKSGLKICAAMFDLQIWFENLCCDV